jgi:spore coat polysaccharide biosynthesis predicted glycosyltransferase SpsG
MGLKEAFAAGDYLTVAASEPAGVEDRLLVATALYRLGREREALRQFGAVEESLESLTRGLLIAARLHLDTPRMAELMRDADLAVGACGVTAWERCALGLPTLAVVIADNQRMIARELAARRAIAFAGDWTEFSEEGMAAAFRRLAADPAATAAMSAAAATICDGRGLERVLVEVAAS